MSRSEPLLELQTRESPSAGSSVQTIVEHVAPHQLTEENEAS